MKAASPQAFIISHFEAPEMRTVEKNKRDREPGLGVRNRIEACRDRLRRNHQSSRSEVIRIDGIAPVAGPPNGHEKLNRPGQRGSEDVLPNHDGSRSK
jgi:hypothetical protein